MTQSPASNLTWRAADSPLLRSGERLTQAVITLRLEECEVPERLSRWQWVDLFREDGYGRLVRALRLKAEDLGVADVRE